MNWNITTEYNYIEEGGLTIVDGIVDFTTTSIDLSFFVIFAGFIIFILFWKIWR